MPPPWAHPRRRRQAAGWAGDGADGDDTDGDLSAAKLGRKIKWDVQWTSDFTFKVEHEAFGISDDSVGDFVAVLDEQIEKHFNGSQPRLIASTLNFSRNYLKDEGVCSMMSFFRRRNISVEKIKLFKNQISDAGVEAIGDLMASVHRPVHEVHLSHNHITERGVRAFFTALWQSGKYPLTLDNSKRMPLWLRMEYNCIDWSSVEEALKQQQINWCVAASRDRWGPKQDPPMVCMHDSYRKQGEAPEDEEFFWVSAEVHAVSSAGIDRALPHEAELLKGLMDATPEAEALRAAAAQPPPQDEGSGGNLLAMLQKVAPEARLRHISLDTQDSVVDVTMYPPPDVQHSSPPSQSQQPQRSSRPQSQLTSPVLQYSTSPILQYSQPPVPGSVVGVEIASMKDEKRWMSEQQWWEDHEVLLPDSQVDRSTKEAAGLHEPVLEEAVPQKATPQEAAPQYRVPHRRARDDRLRKGQQALSYFLKYGDHETRVRWQAHVEASEDPEKEALRIVHMVARLVEKGYISDAAPAQASAPRRRVGAPAPKAGGGQQLLSMLIGHGAAGAQPSRVPAHDGPPGEFSTAEQRSAAHNEYGAAASLQVDPGASRLPGPASYYENSWPSKDRPAALVDNPPEVKSKKGKNKIGAYVASSGASETATAASSTSVGTSLVEASAQRSRESSPLTFGEPSDPVAAPAGPGAGGPKAAPPKDPAAPPPLRARAEEPPVIYQ